MGKYENGKDTRKQIMDAAERLFYEKGFEKTTVRDIAEVSHVSKSLILYHYQSKENLYAQFCYKVLNRLFSQVSHDMSLLKYEALLYSYLFWYKFFNDGNFKSYCKKSLHYFSAPNNTLRQTYITMFNTYGLPETYEEFCNKNENLIPLINGVEDLLISIVEREYPGCSYVDIARIDCLAGARLLGIPDEVTNKKISELEAILQTLDLGALTNPGIQGKN